MTQVRASQAGGALALGISLKRDDVEAHRPGQADDHARLPPT
jgi:hypothetical protein